MRGAPLVAAEDWLAERASDLSPADKEFIQAGAELRKRQNAEREAQRQRELMRVSIGLASQAIVELESVASERGVLLALEALENYPYVPQAERALAQAVYSMHHYTTIRIPDVRLLNAVFSPDGTRIATTGCERVIGIWDSVSGKAIARLNESAMPRGAERLEFIASAN